MTQDEFNKLELNDWVRETGTGRLFRVAQLEVDAKRPSGPRKLSFEQHGVVAPTLVELAPASIERVKV